MFTGLLNSFVKLSGKSLLKISEALNIGIFKILSFEK
jgi:hypothetical protein